jgi:hypothetical protein
MDYVLIEDWRYSMMVYEELTTDQVKVTYGSYGDTVQQIEMLLMPKAKLTLAINENNTIQMTTSDVDFDNSNLSGELSYNVIDTLIRQLIKMRNQLTRED